MQLRAAMIDFEKALLYVVLATVLLMLPNPNITWYVMTVVLIFWVMEMAKFQFWIDFKVWLLNHLCLMQQEDTPEFEQLSRANTRLSHMDLHKRCMSMSSDLCKK